MGNREHLKVLNDKFVLNNHLGLILAIFLSGTFLRFLQQNGSNMPFLYRVPSHSIALIKGQVKDFVTNQIFQANSNLTSQEALKIASSARLAGTVYMIGQ